MVGQWNKGNGDISDFRFRKDETEHIVNFVLDSLFVFFTKKTTYRQNLSVLTHAIKKDYTSIIIQHSANGLNYLSLIITYFFSKWKYFSRNELAMANEICIVVIEKL